MTPYEILRVAPTATFEESTRAYRRLSFQYHPDRNGNSPESHAWLLALNDAYAWVKQMEEERQALAAQTVNVTRIVETAVAAYLDACQRKRDHDAQEAHRAATQAAASAARRRQKRKKEWRRQLGRLEQRLANLILSLEEA